MSRSQSVLFTIGYLLIGVSVCLSVQDADAQETKIPDSPAAKVTGNSKLPRVLLIGDSISIGYTADVQNMLKEEANVLRPGTNCRSTNAGLEFIDAWLGEEKWDVIHFNWGLHDLVYLDKESNPKEKYQQVPVAQYEENLEKLVQRMKKTGATLIWCSTTPVPEGSARRNSTDGPIYNAAALKVMQKHKIQVDDLYEFALPQLAKIQRPKNVHFTPAGSKVLAGQVVTSIRAALKGK